MDGPAIDARGIGRAFGERTAVDGFDLTVGRGELFSLLGPNGAGKTTVIRILCCLLRPTTGSATVMGHDVERERLAVKARIALCPQETAIAEHLSAVENLRLMAALHGMGAAETRARSAELLDMFGLGDRASERVKRYSGGMKRRLSVAMALVTDPEVLFLDEPTIGLDPQSRRGLWEHIRELARHTTIVLTTHYLEEADALADRIGIMDEGRLVAVGSPAELKAAVPGAGTTIVEVTGLRGDAVEALRSRYARVRVVDGGVEIDGDDVTLHDIEDCLRPRGAVVHAVYEKSVSLDDVYIDLTGKALRE